MTASGRAELLAIYDAELRPAEVRMFPPGTVVERDGPVHRVVGASTGFVASPPVIELDEGALVELIERQRDFFAARGQAVEWKTRGHDRPPGLARLLQAAGFVAGDGETVMVGSAEACARDPVLPDGVALAPVATRAGLEAVASMEGAIWHDDHSWLVDDLAERLESGAVSMVAALAAGRPVSAAWTVWVPGSQFAYLAGGGTLPEWRRRGIYRALVASRARSAVARGVRLLAVDASDDSRPILQRLGFTQLTTTTPYVWSPPPP